jgi:hypothetical protein
MSVCEVKYIGIDMGGDCLFRKSGVENLIVSNSDRNKTINIEIYKKPEKAKK